MVQLTHTVSDGGRLSNGLVLLASLKCEETHEWIAGKSWDEMKECAMKCRQLFELEMCVLLCKLQKMCMFSSFEC